MAEFSLISMSSTVAAKWQYFKPHEAVHDAMSRHLIVQAAESAARGRSLDAAQPLRALIIGAGRCRDIPLRDLADRFDRVVINDIDSEKLARGIRDEKLTAAQHSKLDIRLGDILHVTDAFTHAVASALAEDRPTGPGHSDLIERLASYTDTLMPHHGAEAESGVPGAREKLPGAEKYDLIVASCVLSQLHLGAVDFAMQRFARRFADGAGQLRQSQRWLTCMRALATRMQFAFVAMFDDLLTANGRVYLSSTPRVRHVLHAPHSQLKWRHGYQMLAHPSLADFVDESRWHIEAATDWQWAGRKPLAGTASMRRAASHESHSAGHWFDVEALTLRRQTQR